MARENGPPNTIDQMEADDDVWVGVITANTEGHSKPVFCAGADLKALNSGEGARLSGCDEDRRGILNW